MGFETRVGGSSMPSSPELKRSFRPKPKKKGLSPDVKEEGLDAEREQMMAEKNRQETGTDQEAA